MVDQNQQAARAQQILEMKDADGKPIFDHLKDDPASGGQLARCTNDHTQWVRVR